MCQIARDIGILFFLARRVPERREREMPHEQPGSRAQQARTRSVSAARKMAISDALTALAVGDAHATLAYQPTTEHLERAKQVLRTKLVPVVSDTF